MWGRGARRGAVCWGSRCGSSRPVPCPRCCPFIRHYCGHRRCLLFLHSVICLSSVGSSMCIRSRPCAGRHSPRRSLVSPSLPFDPWIVPSRCFAVRGRPRRGGSARSKPSPGGPRVAAGPDTAPRAPGGGCGLVGGPGALVPFAASGRGPLLLSWCSVHPHRMLGSSTPGGAGRGRSAAACPPPGARGRGRARCGPTAPPAAPGVMGVPSGLLLAAPPVAAAFSTVAPCSPVCRCCTRTESLIHCRRGLAWPGLAGPRRTPTFCSSFALLVLLACPRLAHPRVGRRGSARGRARCISKH